MCTTYDSLIPTAPCMCEATITLVQRRQVTMHEFALVCMHRCKGSDLNGSLALAKMAGELIIIK